MEHWRTMGIRLWRPHARRHQQCAVFRRCHAVQVALLMRTLVLLSLFSFVVKFGLMVQISDLWQFILFLFPLLATMQLLKLQMPAPQVFGATDCIYGFVYRGDQSAGI